MERRLKVWRRLAIVIAFAAAVYLFINVGVRLYTQLDTPFMVVSSESMEPTLHVGDLIIVKKVDPNTLKVGDIIVFYVPKDQQKEPIDFPIVHRIVQVIKNSSGIYFKTKGDNNSMVDYWTIPEDHVIGKVIFIIPKFGALLSDENKPLLITVLSILLVISIAYDLYSYSRRVSEDESNEQA